MGEIAISCPSARCDIYDDRRAIGERSRCRGCSSEWNGGSLTLIGAVPEGYLIAGYRPASHHQIIPEVFGAAFDRKPWSSDWHSFDEFDPEGAFVALEAQAGSVVGFALCFQRREFGYISVVAVDPKHQ